MPTPPPAQPSPPRDAPLFRVKICGVTTPEDASMVADAGADAVGLNFVAGSPRRLDPARARAVAAALPASVLRVGVFAGLPGAEVAAIADAVGLDAIQFHGHLARPVTGRGADPWDPPEACVAVAPRPVIRAVRLDADGPAARSLDRARTWLRAAGAAGAPVAMLLVDAGAPPGREGPLGGTGRVVDWQRLVDAGPVGVPLTLAGGLTPQNVAAAIRGTGVAAVDTASGVESSPGRKERRLAVEFVRAALAAFAAARGSV